MQIWTTILQAIQLLTALVMIGLVLVQHGKGADMGASFGSGASGSLFGASGSANFLSRSTAACATLFFASTLALTFLGYGGRAAADDSGGSVLDRPAVAASAPVPAAQIPVAPPGGAASAPTSAANPAIPAAIPAAIPSTKPATPSASGAGN